MTQFVGLANNTKWKELQAALAGRGATAPFWRTRATNGFIYPVSGWDADWSGHFRLGAHKHIEWCELAPRNYEGAISLEETIALCKKIGFEFEVNGDIVRIIGYRRV